ncbi:MAG: oligosaccharide flippase family protein [Candidatus Handelsmanbacteria bacterium]|nr:oligosaccharide flippase family protein [Candidatus Handelsmanbacteria bacterium]
MSSEKKLASQAIHGVFWTGSASAVALFIPLALYSILPSEEMGVYEGALNIVLLLALVGSLGLNSALVQFRQSTDTHFSAAFWINLLAGLLVTALVWLAAPLIAGFYAQDRPEFFRQVLLPLSLLIPFASVSGVFRARLQFELRFREMALAEIASVAAYALAVFGLLWQGAGIWSAVWGAIVREGSLLLTLWAYAAWRPRFACRRAALAEILPFGLHFTGSTTVSYLNSNLAGFLVFSQLGNAEMGYYKWADRLTQMPLLRLSTIITRVSFPTFATIQKNDDLLRRGYLQAVQSIALFFWPALLGLFALAPVLLQVAGMEPALRVLRLLALATAIKAVGLVVGSIFMAKGKANWSLYWSLFSLAVLLPAMLWTVSQGHGVQGVSAAIALTSLLFLIFSQQMANRLISLPLVRYLKALVKPGLVTLVVLAVLAAYLPLSPSSPLPALVLGCLLGAVACLLGLRLFAWELCRQYWRGFRGLASN